MKATRKIAHGKNPDAHPQATQDLMQGYASTKGGTPGMRTPSRVAQRPVASGDGYGDAATDMDLGAAGSQPLNFPRGT